MSHGASASLGLRSGHLPKFQSQSQGTGAICPSRITSISSPQTRVHALVLFLSCPWPQEPQRSFRDAKKAAVFCLRFLPCSTHGKLPPELVTASAVTKAPRMAWVGGGLCILVLPCALPVWFLASHSTSPSFRFLICKMGQEGINSLMCIQCLAYSKCLE